LRNITRKEPVTEAYTTAAHDGDCTKTVLHMKPTAPSSNRLLNTNYACSDLDITGPTSTENIDHMHANMPQVIINTLLNKNTRLKEMLVAQFDETNELATMDKKQFIDEIKYLEGKALKLHEGPTEPMNTKLDSPSSIKEPQRHQKFFFPRPQQNTRLTWNKRAQSLETGRTNFYQTQNNQHDPSTHDGTQSKHEGTKWGEIINTYNEFRDYEHSTEAADKESPSPPSTRRSS
jgi:hypothetical protein